MITDEERQNFKHMGQIEQAMALFDMMRYVRAEIATTKRAVMDLQNDITEYRARRESKEQTTYEKIRSVLGERFDFWSWFRDKVLPAVITLIVIALLYLVFQK